MSLKYHELYSSNIARDIDIALLGNMSQNNDINRHCLAEYLCYLYNNQPDYIVSYGNMLYDIGYYSPEIIDYLFKLSKIAPLIMTTGIRDKLAKDSNSELVSDEDNDYINGVKSIVDNKRIFLLQNESELFYDDNISFTGLNPRQITEDNNLIEEFDMDKYNIIISNYQNSINPISGIYGKLLRDSDLLIVPEQYEVLYKMLDNDFIDISNSFIKYKIPLSEVLKEFVNRHHSFNRQLVSSNKQILRLKKK